MRHASPSQCPSWRNDIAAQIALEQSETLDPAIAARAAAGCAEIEPECDLVEEVLRLRGLDAVPPVSLPRDGACAACHADARSRAAWRWRAARWPRRDWRSASRSASCPPPSAALFGDTPEMLRLVNPIAADLDQLRPTPIATLALAAKRNAARGYPDVALFEVGPEFSVGCCSERASGWPRRAARRLDSTQLARRRHGRWMRWMPRRICGP